MNRRWIGPLAYGVGFCVVLPTCLACWAIRLDASIPLPALSPWGPGAWIAASGVALMLWSMFELRWRGGGLPMNAFPPPRSVATGPYRLMAHPIYVGAFCVALGVALWRGSGAGQWVVAPTLALGSIALVLGYERDDMLRRFGTVPGGFLTRLPAAERQPRSMRDVASAWLGLQLPFLVIFELVAHIPVPDAFVLGPGETTWPVYPATTLVYSLAYPFAFVAPLAIAQSAALRRWILDAWVGVVIGCLAFILVPGISPPRHFDATAPFAGLLMLEQSDGVAGRGALPSFHAFWAFHAARAWIGRGPICTAAALLLASAIAAACVTTGMHAAIDVVAGCALAGLVAMRAWLIARALALAERLANSWREWRIGPVRVLIHAAYPALAAALGIAIVGWRLGSAGALWASLLGIVSILGAALWGQYWTGSSRLLRPFGYFGSVVAVGLALVLLACIAPSTLNAWSLAGALALAAPAMVSIGRLRCLVQGCCHGRPTLDSSMGIRYFHPRSRVVTMAALGGVPVHATPLYSILAHLTIGALLWRFAGLGAPASFLVGAYLILTGLWRFVEEAHRGEPQTPVHAGLRLYQWCAIASVGAGVAATCVSSPPLPPLTPLAQANWTLIAALAAAVGAAHALAMGVDFPQSQRRFSRLADS